VPVHGPQEADFFCIICVFKNAYYNVGFDVFYLKNVLCDFVEELWMKYVR
jgi:hypothetical protein